MKIVRLFFLVFAISTTASAISVYTDAHDGRRQDIPHWEEIAFHQDHTHYSSNQPHWQWTNLTYDIPRETKRIQLTAMDRYNSTYDNEGSYNSEVPYFAVDQQNRKIRISFMWWGIPWSTYLGFGY